MKLYRFSVHFRRMGDLAGIFAVDEVDEQCLEALIKSKREIRFGEVLGKHSDISLPLQKEHFTEVIATPEDVATVLRVLAPRDGKTIEGFSPLRRALYQYEDDADTDKTTFLEWCEGATDAIV